ncbi:unnamed protein product, partial [Vitis vinifera]|uniref:Uncharacterized protein n=1 Tax=Vitis vinifera TaxID=29760 RepID=E0CUS2_VITVI
MFLQIRISFRSFSDEALVKKRRRSKQNCKAPFGLASTLFTAIGGFCGLSLALETSKTKKFVSRLNSHPYLALLGEFINKEKCSSLEGRRSAHCRRCQQHRETMPT